MPISRALLNRLRLPYKALDIQGSKGDVLYIPDDVGVNLSVIHGLHNDNMVPVKSDSDGVVSVAVDSLPLSDLSKSIDTSKPSFTATDSIELQIYDTSKYINYVLVFFVQFVSGSSSNITFTAFNRFANRKSNQIGAATFAKTVGNTGAIYLTENSSGVSSDSIEVDYLTSVPTSEAIIIPSFIGWN